ncbi:MAG: hypothetical protein ACI808_003260 [Paraglaciecola sp.]
MSKTADHLNVLNCERVITHLLTLIRGQGFKPVMHFELEGVFDATNTRKGLDYPGVNRALARLNIDGELKTEFWHNQWEYVSLFRGQTPLKEAQNLANAMQVLPRIMQAHGAKKVSLCPVAWAGDKGRYASGSSAIFSTDTRSVHIPNAIQINVSVEDLQGENLIPKTKLGEWIQYQLLQTSYECCLLFLPEEDAFKRLALRKDYALDAELSSPCVLSGGHQGSIALYKQWGKHNQPMGIEPLFYRADNGVLSFSADWTKTARIEHRIGATSNAYDPFMNVLFILLNVLDALEQWQSCDGFPPEFYDKALPASLHDEDTAIGALTLFEQNTWFSQRIDHYCDSLQSESGDSFGEMLKANFVQRFRPQFVTQV